MFYRGNIVHYSIEQYFFHTGKPFLVEFVLFFFMHNFIVLILGYFDLRIDWCPPGDFSWLNIFQLTGSIRVPILLNIATDRMMIERKHMELNVVVEYCLHQI